jgi:PST family polysaccharide transporter
VIEIGGRQVISLSVFTILARLLDPSAFGLLGIVWVYHAFVGMFVDVGMGTAIIQRKDLHPRHIDAAFWFNMLCSLGMACGTIILAGPISQMLHDARLESLLRWSSIALIVNAAAGVQHALLFRAMDFRRPAIRTLMGNCCGGVVGIVMALAGCGVWSLVGQQLGAALGGTLFLWTASTWRPQFKFSWMCLRELMNTGVSVFSVSFLWFFSRQLHQIVIGRFMGAGVLGQFVVADKVTQLTQMAFQGPVGAVSIPALSQMQDDHPRMCQAIYKGMELNAILSCAVFVGLASVAHDLIPLAFGTQWELAAGICALLALYTLINALQVFFHPALIASGGPGAYVVLNVLHAGGVSVACLVGVRHGIRALILALILNGLMVALPSLLFLRRRIGLSVWTYCRICCPPLFSAFVMAGVVRAVMSAGQWTAPAWSRLTMEVCTGGIAYVATLALITPVSLRRIIETLAHIYGRRSRSDALSSTLPATPSV